MFDYDLIVIGAGPGGYTAAAKAARNGLKTGLIENRELGGTCLNRGCIPTKSLLHDALLYASIKKEAAVFAGNLTIDESALSKKTFETVAYIRDNVAQMLKTSGVDLIQGKALIASNHEVLVNEQTLTSENILIATGSMPMQLPIEGIGQAIDSDGFFQLDLGKIQSIVIIGGGVIGVEIASICNALGKKVTIIEALGSLIANMDKDLGKNLQTILKKRGVDVFVNAKVEKITANTCQYVAKNKQMTVQGDVILAAAGRVANTSNLFKDENMVKLDHGIVVDQDYKACEHIYAIGDVVSGSIKLAHAAQAQGEFIADLLAKKQPLKNPRLIPACVYTWPEIAMVGVNEDQGKQLGYVSVKAPMHGNARTIIAKADRSLMKLVYDPDTRIIKGAHLMCERASDLIDEFTLAIHHALTIEQVYQIVRPHPSFVEAIDDLLQKTL